MRPRGRRLNPRTCSLSLTLMNNYPHPIIAREGWPFLAAALILAIAVTVFAGWGWSFICWLVALFVLQFFRDPAREISADASAILSPADGRVVTVERAEDPFLKREADRKSTRLNSSH